MISLNILVSNLKSFAARHQQINSFRFGDPYEITLDDENTQIEPEPIEYPLLYVITQNGKVSAGDRNTTLRVYISDRVQKGINGELEVLSDMERVCLDCLAYAKNYTTSLHVPGGDFVKLNTDVVLNEFIEYSNAEVTGYWFDLVFVMPFEWDICSMPLTEEVAYILTDLGDYLTTDNNKKLVYD